MPQVNLVAPLTPRQKQLLAHTARILWIGTGTKTGKTFALCMWIMQGVMKGEMCAWVGPWFARSRAAFETIKSLLGPVFNAGEFDINEGFLRIRTRGGGGLDCYSGDNPQALFGGNYSRVVLDEASRMPQAVFTAALTVISASGGSIRCAFNVELGSKNWAIRNLLRAQAMSPEMRLQLGEDFMCFPTGAEGLVSPALIDALRSQMPEPLWRALYLAEIPESDTSLFRNLDQVFAGRELAGPLDGHSYVAGIDLGRKQDWTVVTIVDAGNGAVVACDRFHEISWSLQTMRCAALYKKFRCSKACVDVTGLGDPVAEELEGLGVRVQRFMFTQPSRKALLEKLILACDNVDISVPPGENFSVYRRELELFEYQLDGNTVKYAAPSNCHDDCVMSLALSLEAKGHTPVYGLLELQTRELEAGEAAAVAAAAPAGLKCPKCGDACVNQRFGLAVCAMCAHQWRIVPATAPPVGGRAALFGYDYQANEAEVSKIEEMRLNGRPCECATPPQRRSGWWICPQCGRQWAAESGQPPPKGPPRGGTLEDRAINRNLGPNRFSR